MRDALAAQDVHPLMCATNRVNDAATCETLIERGDCDLVSMARPFLADENLVKKAWEGSEAETNTCIACGSRRRGFARRAPTRRDRPSENKRPKTSKPTQTKHNQQ